MADDGDDLRVGGKTRRDGLGVRRVACVILDGEFDRPLFMPPAALSCSAAS